MNTKTKDNHQNWQQAQAMEEMSDSDLEAVVGGVDVSIGEKNDVTDVDINIILLTANIRVNL